MKELPWVEPLSCAHALFEHEPHEAFAFLYSGMHTRYSGRYSFIGLRPVRQLSLETMDALAPHLTTQGKKFENVWVAVLRYELKNTLESMPADLPWNFTFPAVRAVQFASWLVFDHEVKKLTCYGRPVSIPALPSLAVPEAPDVTSLSSPMTKAAYIASVERTIDAIKSGQFYQANITRKFTGWFSNIVNPLTIARRLFHYSPAPYASFVQLNNCSLISSSPERFITMDSQGYISARPIKGSAPRHADGVKDESERKALASSKKDQAENLMIVDLMRNDLARVCESGTVHVPELFTVDSYATVHHMSSVVKGHKKPDATALDVLKACFPPGSMTGAPKIAAMRWCSQEERVERGIYSGAMGWFGGDGSFDLSVTIRTIIMEGACFEFQVGGGIVADSNPEKEWQETLIKARGMAKALNIALESLEKL